MPRLIPRSGKSRYLRRICRPGLAGLVALLGCVAASAAPAPAPRLVVRVTNLKVDGGILRCGFFASGDGFPREPNKAAVRVIGTINGREGRCEFRDLPASAGAVTAFHDENGNGRMDMRLGFVPMEGIGWSNNPKVTLRPPSYESAKITLRKGENSITIKLNS